MSDEESPFQIALVMACYGQPMMMLKQVQTWLSYDDDIKARLQPIVIDDHGDPAFDCGELESIPNLRIYRVDEQIEWNQMGAKNLGYQECTATWAINMDPDMVITAKAMRQIVDQLDKQGKRGHHYKLGLNHVGGKTTMDYGSPNFYVVHQADFWKAGGYNEDFAGHKGYSDVVLHRTLHDITKRHHWKIAADFYGTAQIDDAMVRSLDRSVKHNNKIFKEAVSFASKHGWRRYPETFRKRGYVRFPWTRVR